MRADTHDGPEQMLHFRGLIHCCSSHVRRSWNSVLQRATGPYIVGTSRKCRDCEFRSAYAARAGHFSSSLEPGLAHCLARGARPAMDSGAVWRNPAAVRLADIREETHEHSVQNATRF